MEGARTLATRSASIVLQAPTLPKGPMVASSAAWDPFLPPKEMDVSRARGFTSRQPVPRTARVAVMVAYRRLVKAAVIPVLLENTLPICPPGALHVRLEKFRMFRRVRSASRALILRFHRRQALVVWPVLMELLLCQAARIAQYAALVLLPTLRARSAISAVLAHTLSKVRTHVHFVRKTRSPIPAEVTVAYHVLSV